MRKILKNIIIIMCVGLIFISTKVNATTGIATNETTRLRKEASTSSDVVDLISQDEKVEITGEDGEWYKVKYSGKAGYVRKDMLSVKEEEKKENSEEENKQNKEKEDTKTENSKEEKTKVEQNNPEKTEENTVPTNTIPVQKGYNSKLLTNIEIKILPTINSSNIATITKDTEYTITDIINKWSYIETEGKSGWILTSKLSGQNVNNEVNKDEEKEENVTEENEKEEETKKEEEKVTEEKTNTTENTSTVKEKETRYIGTEILNVREKPDNNAEVITQFTANTVVTIEEVVDSTWTKVSYKKTVGYVASKYLSKEKIEISTRSEEETRTQTAEKESKPEETEPTTQTSSSSSAKGSEVVEYAKQFLGCKYVSGGMSPSGFDCSGFTSYVYKHFGISLNRTSKDQIKNGVAVEKANLQLGDILIFNDSANSSIGHVGIYIGGNAFIHAANPSKGVITTSLSDSYYKARYVAARRVL